MVYDNNGDHNSPCGFFNVGDYLWGYLFPCYVGLTVG
jgi:hypothetical protein